MVKVHKLVAAIATTFTLSTTGAYALNMGEISWKSAYGQPLNATIELSDTAGLTAKDIQASLATNAEFANAGIIYSNDLAKLTFTTIMGKDGKAYIKVTSTSPIKEPYLDLLVNIAFQGNKVSKDYTILLDLPSATNSTTIATQPTKKADKKETTATATPDETVDSYQTQKGDTLWAVAEKVHGTKNTAKTATAIYKKNPKAFINGSANHLIAGYNIKVPSEQEVQAISVAEATTFLQSTKAPVVSKQDTTKKVEATDKKQAAQLETKLKTSEQQLNNARLENDELSTKLEQLQAEIDKLKEVSEVKDEQIKTIKSQLTEKQTTEPVKTEPTTTEPVKTEPTTTEPVKTEPTTTEPVKTEPATTEPVKTEPATTEPVKTEPTTPEPVKTEPATTKPAKVEPTPTPIQDEDDSLFFGLDSSTLIKIGGGVLLVVCIVALILRRKKAGSDDATEVDLSHITLDDTDEQKALEQGEGQSADNLSIDSPLANLEEGTNILDKADIYLAYNRYNEARDLLVEALKTDPANEEYHLKLLEIYAEQGDSTNFEAAAQELLLQSPLAQHKIDKLKANYPALVSSIGGFHTIEETSAPIASSTLEEVATIPSEAESPVIEEIPTVTEQLVQEPVESPSIPAENIPTADSEDTTPTTFSFETTPEIEDAVSKANANFSLETIHEEPTIEETPLFNTGETSLDGFNTDSPVYEFANEEPKVEDIKEENFKFDLGIGESVSNQEMLPEEKTTEGWSSFSDSFAQSSTTPATEKHSADHLDEIIEKDQVTTKLELVHAYLEMSDTEGAQDLLHEIIQEGNEAQKAEAQKLLASISDNTSSDDIAPEAPAPVIMATEEPLIIEPQPTIATEVAESAITTKDVPVPPKALEETPVTSYNSSSSAMDITPAAAELDLGFELPPEDEVSTKLELARAYIDMGDMNGARDILDEVLKEGDTEQKQQAEQLMATLS